MERADTNSACVNQSGLHRGGGLGKEREKKCHQQRYMRKAPLEVGPGVRHGSLTEPRFLGEQKAS